MEQTGRALVVGNMAVPLIEDILTEETKGGIPVDDGVEREAVGLAIDKDVGWGMVEVPVAEEKTDDSVNNGKLEVDENSSEVVVNPSIGTPDSSCLLLSFWLRM